MRGLLDARPWAIAIVLFALCFGAASAQEAPARPLRVAVYDVQPYGSVDADGLFFGLSVDLWRRVADSLHWRYDFTRVARMDAVLSGLTEGRFDAAIGAITITPERLKRVDFSYPSHRSGVAVAFARQTGLLPTLAAYGAVLLELGSLIALSAALLGVIGILMWILERPGSGGSRAGESSVITPTDGIYWAAVTMTTVGYGDKTPKTPAGRLIAIVWMFGSLALISLLTTALVSRLTADRVEADVRVQMGDLEGKRLAAVAASSGAEYLDHRHLAYARFDTLDAAVTSLVEGRSDAVVNSVGALKYLVSKRFSRLVQLPRGLLEPAYMAIALPPGSHLKKPLDAALLAITASPEWQFLEESYFGK